MKTWNEKNKEIMRYYYIDIQKALDANVDWDDDVIFSVPEDKIIPAKKKTNENDFIPEKDLSKPENEYQYKYYPLRYIFRSDLETNWQMGYFQYYNGDNEAYNLFFKFKNNIIECLKSYHIPVIGLQKNTPYEAVCQVFENVNTGGVSLTVFELVTATYAADGFNLRKDWEKRKKANFQGDLLSVVTETDFLTSLTLFASWKNQKTVTCKRKDVLKLSLLDYQNYADTLTVGFKKAEKLLQEECIFSARDLPYTSQFIPMAAICAALGKETHYNSTRNKIKRWYWRGVFGELYGSANETRFALDMAQVVDWIKGNGKIPKTCQDMSFSPMRLLSLQTRNAAAYKGVMALILKNHSKDFVSGSPMDFAAYQNENIDIHHIFPKKYCQDQKIDKIRWQSVVNKTPISGKTNKIIGGAAPSKYRNKMLQAGQIDEKTLDSCFKSHWIDPESIKTDDFDQFFTLRAIQILNAIENATRSKIVGRDSEEVIEHFGGVLNILTRLDV